MGFCVFGGASGVRASCVHRGCKFEFSTLLVERPRKGEAVAPDPKSLNLDSSTYSPPPIVTP